MQRIITVGKTMQIQKDLQNDSQLFMYNLGCNVGSFTLMRFFSISDDIFESKVWIDLCMKSKYQIYLILNDIPHPQLLIFSLLISNLNLLSNSPFWKSSET